MSTPLSSHAQRAIGRLGDSDFINWCVRSDAVRNDAHVPSVDSPNLRFNAALELYLASSQVTLAGDTFNSYCQSILGEIVQANAEVWQKIRNRFGRLKDKEHAEVAKALFAHRAGDGPVREALRDDLCRFWFSESDVVIKLRNKLVHQNGYDPEREVEKEIASPSEKQCGFTPVDWTGTSIPIRYDEGDWLNIDAEVGQWACTYVRHHIHLMDQSLCHIYSLPLERWVPRAISRQIASATHPKPHQGVAPGQSLSTLLVSPPTMTSQQNTPSTQEASSRPKPSEEEIACAKTWGLLGKSLSDFVPSYAAKLNLHLVGQSRRLAGTVLPYTRRGHDCHYDWTYMPNTSDVGDDRETVSIRLRQREFKPFITVWGTRSEMRDFEVTEDQMPVLEYLKDCLDKTLTRA